MAAQPKSRSFDSKVVASPVQPCAVLIHVPYLRWWQRKF